MRLSHLSLFFTLALAASAPLARAQSGDLPENLLPQANQLVDLANQARAEAGLSPLYWDPALAQAALLHCVRMTAGGAISHQYPGEPDLATRGAQAGAHFGMIEENIAIGNDAAQIHSEWMRSPGHRANMLNPQVDRVGVAVLESRGILYAVADFSYAVRELTPSQVEAVIANLLRHSGLTVLADPGPARSYCSTEQGPFGEPQPGFKMLWQSPDLTTLPQQLTSHIATGQYHGADIGNCPAGGKQNGFTAYRIAVLLY